MMLGSHNTFSYLKPKRPLLRPFAFMARCQRVSVEEQLKLGVGLIDVRLCVEEGELRFCHGLMSYEGNPQEILERLFTSLSERKQVIAVRVILERDCDKAGKALFREFCSWLEVKFPDQKFFDGRLKSDWSGPKVYEFKTKLEDTQLVDRYSSVTGSVLDDWYPWWYAKRNNKYLKDWALYWTSDNRYMFIDFVDYP